MQAKVVVEPIVDLAVEHGYTRRLAQIHTILGQYVYTVEEDLPKASKLLQEAMKAAEATGDLISLVMANHWMGHILADNCEFERAIMIELALFPPKRRQSPYISCVFMGTLILQPLIIGGFIYLWGVVG